MGTEKYGNRDCCEMGAGLSRIMDIEWLRKRWSPGPKHLTSLVQTQNKHCWWIGFYMVSCLFVFMFWFVSFFNRTPAMGVKILHLTVLQYCHVDWTFESSYYMCFVTAIISYFQIKYALSRTVTRNGVSASENSPFCS